MRWLVRYLSYVAAAAALLVIALGAAFLMLLVVERYGAVWLDGPGVVDVVGQLGVTILLAATFAMPMIVGAAVATPVFRTIAQVGWLHALPWLVIWLNWVLASALLVGTIFAVLMGYVTIFEGVVLFLGVIATIGFGWHVFCQRWVTCPSDAREMAEAQHA